MLFAARMSGSFVIPLGSNRIWANFEQHTWPWSLKSAVAASDGECTVTP
jgi:hypothetical protein